MGPSFTGTTQEEAAQTASPRFLYQYKDSIRLSKTKTETTQKESCLKEHDQRPGGALDSGQPFRGCSEWSRNEVAFEGLSFCPTPRHINKEETLDDLESYLRWLPYKVTCTQCINKTGVYLRENSFWGNMVDWETLLAEIFTWHLFVLFNFHR